MPRVDQAIIMALNAAKSRYQWVARSVPKTEFAKQANERALSISHMIERINKHDINLDKGMAKSEFMEADKLLRDCCREHQLKIPALFIPNIMLEGSAANHPNRFIQNTTQPPTQEKRSTPKPKFKSGTR